MSLAHNLENIRQRIAAAAQRAGRNPADVTLIAVSKTHPLAAVQAAYELGVRHFGESRVEEALPKIEGMRTWLAQQSSPEQIYWHMIGHLQSRKAADVVDDFALVHSVDRLKIAQKLAQQAAERGRVLRVLLEVNISGEQSKFGVTPSEAALIANEISQWNTMKLTGLMTMAPIVNSPADARPFFRGLRELREQLRVAVPQIRWEHLSMGMSDDFEVAIEEGATLVRVGRAIFGDR